MEIEVNIIGNYLVFTRRYIEIYDILVENFVSNLHNLRLKSWWTDAIENNCLTLLQLT